MKSKTFTNGVINYDNHNIEILTIEEVLYLEYNKLMILCSIYKVKEDLSGYEDKKLNWNLK